MNAQQLLAYAEALGRVASLVEAIVTGLRKGSKLVTPEAIEAEMTKLEANVAETNAEIDALIAEKAKKEIP